MAHRVGRGNFKLKIKVKIMFTANFILPCNPRCTNLVKSKSSFSVRKYGHWGWQRLESAQAPNSLVHCTDSLKGDPLEAGFLGLNPKHVFNQKAILELGRRRRPRWGGIPR